MGPIVGGAFTTYLSWRYVFAGEVVIVVAILLLTRRIDEQQTADAQVRLDWVGTALSALGLALIVFGILRAGTWGFVKPKPGSAAVDRSFAHDLAAARREGSSCELS